MTPKHKFLFRLGLLQILLVLIAATAVPSLIGLVRAQTPVSEDPAYLGMVVIGVALSISIPALAAGLVLKSAITAALSAITERESTFGKALVLVALGEAIAVYGLIISIMLMQQLPTAA